MSTWLTVQEAASLSGVTESAIKKAVKQNRYEHCHVDGVGRGGKQLRIALESLPEEAQARYRGEQEAQREQADPGRSQREEDEAYFKFMIGG